VRLIASHLHRYSRAPARESLLLTLVDHEGNEGRGEAAPFAAFSRSSRRSCEDAAACAAALEGIHLRLAPLDHAAPAPLAIARALAPIEAALADLPSARFALECALFDLLAARRGLSVASCLGSTGAYARAPVNGLLFAEPTDTLVARALALAHTGIEAIKVKLRGQDDDAFARELAALAALRAALPLPFELRLDPNATWTVEQAHSRLEELAPIAPRYVEQPVAPERLLDLGHTAVPWAADESLLDPALVEPILDSQRCAAVILKPHALGGLVRARELALAAQARGMGAVITHFFDGPVGVAAACELALSLPALPLACGLDRHEALAHYPPWSISQLAERGFVVASRRPGMGLHIPPA